MEENKYDNSAFFEQYSQMDRSIKGLAGAGEWHAFEKLMPDFKDKRVLDLGCGFGWHCIYAEEHGASSVIGIDLSEKMIAEAKKKTTSSRIQYSQQGIGEFDYSKNQFDVVLSSLAFHYLESFEEICRHVANCLVTGGDFVFSVEHPIFTAEGRQDWTYDEAGNSLNWPVDRYFMESQRTSIFLGEEVVKYHKTMTTYLNTLLLNGFEITQIVEPLPDERMLDTVPGMRDELRRPMMLLIAAKKK
ncbi:class I SAM-dependent methyltransferase [Carnobacterium gallinarum]|uniref:class I SAM-dependent methyltransferase n=1 Tax=Carnobacterium gallinarum TaxID=2749 RepID=UPI0005594183|nr:class I SAM-dependent methyltransferase [Carnobacterium gallinarum]